jgi:hypothetical protein
LVIPQRYSATLRDEQFYLADREVRGGRLLIFSTMENLHRLAECKHWFADGTFSTVPLLFYQLYTIFGLAFGTAVPLVYALLPNKRRETYAALFDELRMLADNLAPRTIMMDFERSAISAFQESFPGAEVRGCFFHFQQCLYRKLQELGYSRLYDTNKHFAKRVRMFAALAFVPVRSVRRYANQLLGYADSVDSVELQQFARYFEETWLGEAVGGDAARFPVSLWNCWYSLNNNLPRTNNCAEGFHRAFFQLLGAHHPSIWKFLDALLLMQGRMETECMQYEAGGKPPKPRVKYQLMHAKLVHLAASFATKQPLHYLRTVSHNLMH